MDAPSAVMIPESFDEAFLKWFREITERRWAEREPPSLEDYVARRVGGCEFQRGTRWKGGLSDAQIDEIELRRSTRFPPDYRLFLRVLHATDRPMVGAGFVDAVRMEADESPGFRSWLTEADAIAESLEWVFDGLVFDVENEVLWPPTWGPRPSSPEERSARLRALFDAAPGLIPVVGHRFLVGEPCRAGNPVISVHQSDIIIAGTDLRDFLIHFAEERRPTDDDAHVLALRDSASIPFWGELIS